MRVLRLGVLGCASIALRRVIPAMKQADGVELIAVASRDLAKARQVASQFGCAAVGGYDALLDRSDIDAVYVPLPAGLHALWVSRALAAGKHVLSEKPLTTDHASAVELVRQARQAGLWLMENFMFLHHSQHKKVRGLVMDGRIGEPRVFTASFGIPPLDPGDVRYRADLGGGALLDVGVYPIRAATYFLGTDFLSADVLGADVLGTDFPGTDFLGTDFPGTGLEVVGSALRHDRTRGVDVSGHALLRAPSGATAELSFGFEHAYRSCYSLWGELGRLSLSRAFTPPPELQPVLRIDSQDRAEEITLRADHQFKNIIEAFASSIRQGRDYEPQARAIIEQARLVDQVRAKASQINIRHAQDFRTPMGQC